jgi:hypothetical protein
MIQHWVETARAIPHAGMNALHADGVLFIGRIKSYSVEQKFIAE